MNLKEKVLQDFKKGETGGAILDVVAYIESLENRIKNLEVTQKDLKSQADQKFCESFANDRP